MQNAWPAWAGQMIDSSRLPGHVDLPAPRAAQMAALLANENRQELYRCNSIRQEEAEARLDEYDLLLPSLLKMKLISPSLEGQVTKLRNRLSAETHSCQENFAY